MARLHSGCVVNQTQLALERLERALAAAGAAIDSFLAPGIDRDRLAVATSSLPFEPCEDIADLYGWHDGIDVERAATGGDEAWELAPSIYFPPLAGAVQAYHELSALSRRITPLPNESRADYWNDQWFPVFRSGSASFVISNSLEDRGVVRFLTWEQPALIAYGGLEEMADRLRGWIESGAVSVDAAGRMTPRFELLQDEERAYPYFW